MSRKRTVSIAVHQPGRVHLEPITTTGTRTSAVALTSPTPRVTPRRAGVRAPDLQYLVRLLGGGAKPVLPAKLRVRAPRPSRVPALSKQARFPVSSIDFSRPD